MIRHKVLFTKDMKQFLVETSEALDSSVGDSIRMFISITLIKSFMQLYPDYKPTLNVLGMHDEIIKNCREGKFDLEKRKRIIVDSLMECKHALKYHNEQKDKKFF